MAEHNELGKKGEEIALAYLRKKHYEILETNWRTGKYEVDIIAKHDNTLIIIEVKTRSSSYLVEPEFSVNKIKQQSLIRAADIYVERKDMDIEIQFDIISIIVNKNQHLIEHLEDAFYPTY